MSFNITEFMGAMTGDGVRPNLFEVSVVGFGSDFTFKAKATSIPSSSIGVASTYYYGRMVKFAGNRTFDNWTVSVLLDEDDYTSGGIRGMFELWSSSLNTHIGNRRTASTNLASYARTCTVNQMSKIGGQIGLYNMFFAFPIDISPISLDWSANDSIAEFSVTFAYQYWTSLAAT